MLVTILVLLCFLLINSFVFFNQKEFCNFKILNVTKSNNKYTTTDI